MPAAPQVDWALVIRQTILGERAHMTEAIGGAIAEYGDELGDSIVADVERMVAATAAELREEFSRQIDQLRAELAEQGNELFASVATVHGQGERLKAQLEAVTAKKTRARAAKPNGSNGEHLLLPAPAASLAPGVNGNGDGRS
jgi:hypothetical protein